MARADVLNDLSVDKKPDLSGDADYKLDQQEMIVGGYGDFVKNGENATTVDLKFVHWILGAQSLL